MSKANELDFAICFTSRTVLQGNGIACACCFQAMDRPRSPISVCVDRVGARPVCDTCAMNFATLLDKLVRQFYGPTFDRSSATRQCTPARDVIAVTELDETYEPLAQFASRVEELKIEGENPLARPDGGDLG